MTTPKAWWLVIWGRLRCRALGWHDWRLRTSHGYRVAWCARCWSNSLERVS